MAEKIVSPGVFTNEKDLSFLPAGIAEIGAAIIGPTIKGPAFAPTIINNFDEFIAQFGGLSEDTYVPYAVKSYLAAAGTVTIIRVLQEGGYNAGAIQIIWSGSASPTASLVGLIMPTHNTADGASTGNGFTSSIFTQDVSLTGSAEGITLEGVGVSAQIITASADPTSVSNFDNVLGSSPKGAKKGYMYVWFDNFLSSQTAKSGSISYETGSVAAHVDYSGSTAGEASPAATPYVVSQIIGSEKLDLFKVKTIADGTNTNTTLKISVINNVLPGGNPASDYGSFTLLIREYGDTDQRPVVLESFSSLNLDPDSSNYIARRIGDRYKVVSDAGVVTINGDYNNISQYIYIDVTADVAAKAITPNVKPFGFDAYVQPIVSAYAMPTASFTKENTEINGAYNKKAYYGHDFGSLSDNNNFLLPLANGTTQMVDNDFNLDECFVHPSASKADENSAFTGGASISGSSFAGVDISNILKFTIGLQGGNDAEDPAIDKNVGAAITPGNVMGMDCTTASSKGSVAYIKALAVVNNPEDLDVNLIVAPGITVADHSSITNKMIEVAEDRGDCFTIVDPVVQGNTKGAAISAITSAGLDTSYAGVYWPWVKILDTDKNKPVWVPPSAVLPRVIANSDNVAYEWFAPAGLNRGGIREAVDVESKLRQSDRDDLYENRVNAIANFPNQGICVWGQKTLQAKPSALDRINVRRLLITLKKYIASATRYLVFENNTTETRSRFLNIVNPYLETVKSRQGLYAYRVVMDETNNTPDVIDRNQMYGQIFLQPAKSAEFIILDFNILPTGATFDNA